MASYIGRRKFLATLGGAATWPLAAGAQQPGKLPTVGFFGAYTAVVQSQWTAALVQRLRELGWIEGHTIAIEYRWAEGRNERFAEIAAEFVRLKVDVIVTSGTPPVLARFFRVSRPVCSNVLRPRSIRFRYDGDPRVRLGSLLSAK